MIPSYMIPNPAPPVPTQEQNAAWVARVKRGDSQALEELMLANLRLVAAYVMPWARRYQHRAQDIFQVGVLGLYDAAHKFEPGTTTFATYLRHHVKKEVCSYLSLSHLVTMPRNHGMVIARINQLLPEFTNSRGDVDIPAMWEEYLRVFGKKNVTTIKTFTLIVNACLPRGGDALGPVADIAAPQAYDGLQKSDREAVVAIIAKAMRALAPRERKIIELRFGLGGQRPQSLEEVGASLGLTRERIRQLQNQALEKLRLVVPKELHDAIGGGL